MESVSSPQEKRSRRPPQHLVDYLPSDPHPLHQFSKKYQELAEVQESKCRRTELLEPQRLPTPPPPTLFETEPNEVGLFRRYTVLPSQDPEEENTIHHVADAPTFVKEPATADCLASPLAGFGPTAQEVVDQPQARPGITASLFFPFLNATVCQLMFWYYSLKNLTLSALDQLVHNVILAPDFWCEDLEGFSAVQENRHLDDESINHLSRTSDSVPWLSSDVWKKSSVFLPLPFTCKTYKSENHAPTVQIDFYHQNLVEVLKSGTMDFAAKWFHWHGFQLYWKPSENEPEQHVYGKVYTSDQFLELENTVTPVEGCNLERVVLLLMFHLDSTHLANFGTASLWPLYMWFDNISKYTHGKVNRFLAHHLAYLPSLPDIVKDQYKEVYGNTPAKGVLTHLRRELIQPVWKHLLTDEFKPIYKEGIVVNIKQMGI
ncbi:hypothetical protein C0992_003755 [Termitomyces sp. T32_za158]|nr:hypothetical protein C0992_003755 [Termitomyces sp. T32_za158]